MLLHNHIKTFPEERLDLDASTLASGAGNMQFNLPALGLDSNFDLNNLPVCSGYDTSSLVLNYKLQ